ncbi:MAG: porin family protein [Saprospiraceae bacterium]|nr:porin family protein [Saprospiraceae bacterium]
MKRFTQILAFVFVTSSLAAQMSIGIKSGISVNKYSRSEVINDEWDAPSTLGYSAGVALDIPFGGRMGIETGVYWTRKGSQLESENSRFQLQDQNGETIGIWLNSTEKLNYLTIPVHLKMQFRGKALGSFIMAGPEFNFALGGTYSNSYVDQSGRVVQGAEDVLNANGVATSGEIEFGSGANDIYNSFDFGISVGGGLFYELEFGKVTFDARYFFGMSNLINTDDNDTKLKNKNLMIQVGYAIPLGGRW